METLRLDVQLTKANNALFAQDCKICKCMWRRCKKQTTTNFPFVLLGVRQWRNAILLQLQLDTSQISVPCIWQRWKWEVYDKYFWRLGEPRQRPRHFHKTWAGALKAVRLITIVQILKMWIWSLCSPTRNHWGGSCGRWEGWDRGQPLRLPCQLKEVHSRNSIEHNSFCFCFCFEKSLNSEFEGLSKLVCVDVVVALVFKATEVRQWALLCNILFNSRFLFFESNNYFASALCTDAVCEEK